MVTSYSRGHKIYYQNAWKYCDNDQPLDIFRPCKRCGMPPTKEGYDHCLGYIEKSTNACCGHGLYEGYIKMEKDIWEIECLQAGQPRAYADSYYEYIVYNKGDIEYTEKVFKDLCTKFVYPIKDDGEDGWWKPKYTLTKIDNRTYRYCITVPYTD